MASPSANAKICKTFRNRTKSFLHPCQPQSMNPVMMRTASRGGNIAINRASNRADGGTPIMFQPPDLLPTGSNGACS